jgi:hypothetical protein
MTTYAAPFSGSEINPPNIGQGLQTIGSIVNTVQGLQGMAQAAQLNPIAVQEAGLKLTQEQAQTQTIQQQNEERKIWQQKLASGGLQTNADGTPNLGYSTGDLYKAGDVMLDPNTRQPVVGGNGQPQIVSPDQIGQPKPGAQTFSDWVAKNMPYSGQSYLQQLAKTTSDTNTANKSALALKSTQLQGLGGAIAASNVSGATIMDIRNGAQGWIDNQDPATQAAVRPQLEPILNQLEHRLGTAASASADGTHYEASRNAVVQGFVARLNALGTTKDIQETQYGKPITPTTTGVVQGAGQAAVPQGDTIAGPVLPTQIVTEPGSGDLSVVGAGAGGQGTGGKGGPAPASPFNTIPQGESADSFKQFTAQRQAAQQAAQQANTVASNNKQVLQLLKQGTTTGPGAQTAQNLIGSLMTQKIAGVTGWQPTEAANLSSITHYLNQNLASQAETMGVPKTNEGAEIAQAVTGGTTMPTVSLARAVKANDALTSGVQDFNSGNEAAIKAWQASGKQGNPIFAMRQFKNDWANNFNPDVYKIANALRDGDTVEQNRIFAEYGKPAPGKAAPPQWNAFLGQIKALNSLKTTGALPQAGQ